MVFEKRGVKNARFGEKEGEGAESGELTPQCLKEIWHLPF